jgi:hypothetical protein
MIRASDQATEIFLRSLTMGHVLGSLRFFQPEASFLDWMSSRYRGQIIYDVGAGAGHVSVRLRDRGLDVRPIDIFRHECPEDAVTIADGTIFAYRPGSVVMLCRPNHGRFVGQVIAQADACRVREVLYVGLAGNMMTDLGDRAVRAGQVLTGAGKEDECVWRLTMDKGKRRGPKTMKVVLLQVAFPAGIWWYQDDGDRWGNLGGGYMYKSPTDRVIDTAEIEDGAWETLDWKRTSLLDPESGAGWLAPDGSFLGCESQRHDLVSWLVLHSTTGEVERDHVRVYEGPDRFGRGGHYAPPQQARMTAEQRNWLTMHGHEVPE